MPKPSITLDLDQINEIKTQATAISQDHAKLAILYKRYQDIYFMENAEKPKGNNVDDNDWKITVSPSGRNSVIGMKRLLDTSEIHITITVNGEPTSKSDQLERGLKHILDQSGMVRMARVEKDLNLSAVLYGPAILAAESVDDLLKVQTSPAQRRRLEKIRTYTPFLLRALPPPESYSRWGELGMMAHLRKYVLLGDAVKDRWGVEGLKRTQKYTVYDYMDLENRVVWIDRGTTILAKPHLMPSMNIAAKYAGGSSLFDESDKQMQGFLYAHTKGEWDKRENLFWTYLFTALFMQGLPGPLLIVDPESVPPGDEPLEIDFTGGVRKIFAKAQLEKYPVIDGDVLRIKDLMDATHAESTIYKQTLGQNIEASTFSGLAMLSSSGQLPLEDPKEAICAVFRDMFDHILCRIKEDGIDSPYLHPTDIPDDYEIEVEMEPKLPQDNLRNSQIAQGLGDLVSDEWKHEKLLQITDSRAMRKTVIKENLLKGLISAMLGDQQLVMELVNMALGRQPAAPPNVAGAPGQAGPPPPEGEMPAEELASPEMMMAAGERLPATGPMPMPGEMIGGQGGPGQY